MKPRTLFYLKAVNSDDRFVCVIVKTNKWEDVYVIEFVGEKMTSYNGDNQETRKKYAHYIPYSHELNGDLVQKDDFVEVRYNNLLFSMQDQLDKVLRDLEIEND